MCIHACYIRPRNVMQCNVTLIVARRKCNALQYHAMKGSVMHVCGHSRLYEYVGVSSHLSRTAAGREMLATIATSATRQKQKPGATAFRGAGGSNAAKPNELCARPGRVGRRGRVQGRAGGRVVRGLV